MLHKYVECYVEDLVVKSKRRQDHLKDLKVVFDRLQKYQLRMNPLKCTFGVTSGKFLGFIVRHQGIEIDQSKIDVIQKMPRPKSLHDLRSLQGRLAYIRRFISNLAGAPIPGKPLILYIDAQERSLGALLAQEKEKGKEHALYCLSRTLVGAEVNYSPIEKMCLALFFAIDKLRHYMQAFTVHLVAKADPIKYVLSRPIISGCLAKWAVILQQYDIVYISQKAIKGQALADFLADHPIPSYWKLCEDLPDDEVFFMEVVKPWTMYFNGAARRSGAGAGIALIIGLEMALEIGVSFIEIYGDSKLIINQLSLQYDVKHEDLKPYFTYARQLMEICVGKEESIKALEEAHARVCGAHQSGPKLQFQLRRMGYYWPKMVQDSMDYAKNCEACQYHANFIHQPLEPLHSTVASWPFEA
ncbi:uncharacterized protein E5676_scaffold169G00990 [Cucumis melo var. makuwa]|uniref:Reverse transcriptase domain-containing protein n=1 Tax=Cucumis melo var. makuwa TaxID=1194695 RepID=A0A5D3BND7_CUCMM|nr:uncharacterized protein E6C27_scaffold64G001010 [Cucumis melo var. makuwa]TYK00490.1 uncharacterized protein E5676_scaffold169G00990 [Cucumis melo var. makuwa]